MTRDTLNVTDFTAYWLEQAYDAQRGRELLEITDKVAFQLFSVSSFDADGDIPSTADMVIVTVDGITVTMPPAADRQQPVLVRCDAAWCVVAATDLIENESTFTLYEAETIMLASDGVTWRGV